MTILQKVKLYLDINGGGQDELLEGMIEDAENYVKTFCGISEIPTALNSTIAKMVVIDYNKRGSEGLNSESYAGASYGYQSDYPSEIKNALYRERVVTI